RCITIVGAGLPGRSWGTLLQDAIQRTRFKYSNCERMIIRGHIASHLIEFRVRALRIAIRELAFAGSIHFKPAVVLLWNIGKKFDRLPSVLIINYRRHYVKSGR